MTALKGEVDAKEKELHKLRGERQRRAKKCDDLTKWVEEVEETALHAKQRERELDQAVGSLVELAHNALDQLQRLTDQIRRPRHDMFDDAGRISRKRHQGARDGPSGAAVSSSAPRRAT